MRRLAAIALSVALLLVVAPCATAFADTGPGAPGIWSTTLPFRFHVSGLSLREIDPSDCPLLHLDEPIPIVDEGLRDADGVRMVLRNGQLYNRVSAQCFYGLENLASYTLTGDPLYLQRAEAQAQRLIDRRILVGEAWFHPVDFSFHKMRPPWYSAMGQGLSLKLFTALSRVTGDPAFQEAAAGTFAGFLHRGPSASPWIVSVDANGYLWLQEYPSKPPDPVLNGHIFAAYGLYDYYQATHDERALELFDGAVTTVLHYAPWFRQPGWMSFYRYSRQVAWARYHEIHIHQFLTLYRLTGRAALARLADDFVRDYPKPAISGSVTVVPGVYTGLRFDSSGRVVGRRTWRIITSAHLTATRRERQGGDDDLLIGEGRRVRIHRRPGYWFLTTSGPWTGYYLREQAGNVYLPGVLPLLSYDPPRTLLLSAGYAYVARAFDADGAVTATLDFAPEAATKATVDLRAVVNGTDQVRVVDGPLQGYWLRLGPATLR